MSSVDDRIVNMQFNNKQFTQGIAESQKSLAGLEKSLGSAAGAKGLTQLGSAADNVKKHFSAMSIASIAAIGTIASKATSAGINMVKSFTLDPLKSGFQSYETQINATQTIIANTGSKMKPVTKSLADLQTYANQTVYSFADMAQNIGTFTAAGVKLKPAVADIKGIANVAALSGSSSQQASTAMYQLSQAVAAGSVKLQDWNSVVNAGMGGKRLQDALKMTSESVGGSADAMIKKFGSFRQSLQGGWVTGDVLNKTMKVMAGRFDATTGKTNAYSVAALKAMGYTEAQAKSMHKVSQAAIDSATHIKTWTQLTDALKEEVATAYGSIFKTLFGGLKGSTKLFTGMHNVMESALTGPLYAINKVLIGWKKDGGRVALFDGLKNTFGALGKIIAQVKIAFKDIFPPTASSTLANLTKGFDAFSKHLIPGTKTLENLRTIFEGVFAVLHIATTIIGGVVRGFAAFFGEILSGSTGASGGILSIVASVAKVLIAFDKWLTAGGKLSDTLANAGKVAGEFVKPFIQGIGLAIQGIAKFVSSLGSISLSDMKDAAVAVVNAIVDLVQKLNLIPKAAQAFDVVKKKLSGFSLSDINFGSIKGAIGGAVGDAAGMGASIIKSIVQSIKGASLSSVAGSMKDIGSNILQGIVEGLKGASLGLIKSSMENIGTMIIDAIKGVLGIHSPAREMIPIGQYVIQGIIKGLEMDAVMIPKTIKTIGVAIASEFQKLFGNMNAQDWVGVFNSLLTGSLLLSLKKFTDSLKAASGVFGSIGGAFDQLKESIEAYTNGSIKVKMLQAIALAIGVLTASLVALSFIDPKKLAVGLGAISVMLAQIVLTMKALSSVKKGDVNAAVLAGAMAIMSAAILTLAGAVAIFGNMKMGTLEQGLGALATTLALVTGTMMGLGKAGPQTEGAAGSILVIALAINVLAAAVLEFGKMKMGTLSKGLGAVATTLAMVVGTMMGLGKAGPQAEGAAGSILVVALAINILAAAVAAFGNMDMSTLEKGLGAVAAALALMVGAMSGLAKQGPMIEGAAGSILIISGAMLILSKVVSTLGAMDMSTLAKGFAALAVGLGLMVGTILVLSGNSVGVVAAGVALAAFAVAINILVGAIGTLGAMDFGTIVKGLLALTALAIPIGVIGAVAMAVSPGLIALGAAVALMGVGILGAGVGIYYLTKAIQNLGAIFKSVVGALSGPIKAFGTMFTGLGPVVKNMFNGMVKFIKDILSPIVGWIGDLLGKLGSKIKDGAGNIVGKFKSMFSDAVSAIGGFAGKMASAAANLVTSLVSGIKSHISDVASKVKSGVQNALDAVKDKIKDFATQGAEMAGHLLSGLAGGLKDAALGPLKSAAEHVADALPGWMKKVLHIKSPSRVMHEIGKWVSIGLANGVSDHARSALLQMQKLADGLVDTGNKAATAMRKTADSARKDADKSKKEQKKNQKDQDKQDKKNDKKDKKKKKKQKAAPKLTATQQYVADATAAKNLQIAADAAQKKADKLQKEADKKGASKAKKAAAKKASAAATAAKKAAAAAKKATAKQGAALVSTVGPAATRAAAANPSTELSAGAQIALQQHIIAQDALQKFSDSTGSYQYNNYSGMADAQKSLGDAFTSQAQDLTTAAQNKLAASQAEAQKAAAAVAAANAKVAKDKKGTDKYKKDVKAAKDAADQAAKLKAQAQADAKAAQTYAQQAAAAYNNASAAFVASITDQVKSLQANQAAFTASQKWTADFNAADTTTQAQMLNTRAAQEQADADAKNKLANQLMAQAQAEAATNAAQAQADMDAANQAVQDAQASANAAQQDQDQAKQLLDQATSASMSASLTPSKTALEDAAKSVDRYSASLAEAESLAGAASGPVTYVQNNYSPEALSATEIYRNSKNLLAATEIKMGAN